MARARIADDAGEGAVRAAVAGGAAVADGAAGRGGGSGGGAGSGDSGRGEASGIASVPRDTVAMAVRYLLQLLAEKAPGNTVEVRVPPFGAVQCVEGPRHTRGTPPNVVEMDSATWLALATGAASWDERLAAGVVHASGQRADLAAYVPVLRLRPVG